MAKKPQKNEESIPPEVIEKHSEQDKELELSLMLLPAGGTLTAGGFFRLWLDKNSFVCGTTPTPGDAEKLVRECGCQDLETALEILSASFRALECISETAKSSGSAYEGYSPEWLADIVSGACSVCPMSWEDAVWKISLCTLTHLALANCRRMHLKTGRPKDWTAVDKWLIEQNQSCKTIK